MVTLDYSEQFNYLAIEWLEKLGNTNPNQKQVDLMEALLSRIAISSASPQRAPLTKSEKICLLLIGAGKKKREISHLMNLDKETINHYYKIIPQKCGCKTIAQTALQVMKFDF